MMERVDEAYHLHMLYPFDAWYDHYWGDVGALVREVRAHRIELNAWRIKAVEREAEIVRLNQEARSP